MEQTTNTSNQVQPYIDVGPSPTFTCLKCLLPCQVMTYRRNQWLTENRSMCCKAAVKLRREEK